MAEVMFGRYELIGLIGEGGMGQVFRANDTMMRRPVAIKVLPAELANQPGYRQRFEREAYTAARLTNRTSSRSMKPGRSRAGCIWRCRSSTASTWPLCYIATGR